MKQIVILILFATLFVACNNDAHDEDPVMPDLTQISLKGSNTARIEYIGKIGKDFMYYEDSSSLTESIVLKLLSCIKDKKQRNIFCDGWYSSISLMKKLTDMGYLNTTILRANSKEVPQKLNKKL